VARDGRIISMYAMWTTSPTAEGVLGAVLVLFDSTTLGDISFMLNSLVSTLPDPID